MLSDLDFFKKIGGYKSDPDTGEEGFTLAAVLMFGLEQTILRFLPHYYVDFREKLSTDPASVGLIGFIQMVHGRLTCISSTAEFT